MTHLAAALPERCGKIRPKPRTLSEALPHPTDL